MTNKSETTTKLHPVTSKPNEASEVKKNKPKPERANLSQREAVYLEILRVLKEDKINFDATSTAKPHITEERLKRVYDGLIAGFQTKKIALKENESNQKKLAEVALLRTYCAGLVNNWLRRDPRLNGKGEKKA